MDVVIDFAQARRARMANNGETERPGLVPVPAKVRRRLVCIAPEYLVFFVPEGVATMCFACGLPSAVYLVGGENGKHIGFCARCASASQQNIA